MLQTAYYDTWTLRTSWLALQEFYTAKRRWINQERRLFFEYTCQDPNQKERRLHNNLTWIQKIKLDSDNSDCTEIVAVVLTDYLLPQSALEIATKANKKYRSNHLSVILL